MEELFFKHIKINILKQHITHIKKRCTGSRELSEQITHPTENPANHSCPLLTGQWVAVSSKSSGRSLEGKPWLAHSQARSFQLTSKAEEEPWSKDIRTSLCRLANSSRVAELLSMGYMAGFA